MNKASKKYGIMWKDKNQCLIGVPETDGENETQLENPLQDIIRENFPNLARQANIQNQELQRTPQRYFLRRATPRHIIVRFTKVKMKENAKSSQRETLGNPQREAHQTHNRSLSRNPACQKRVGVNVQHPWRTELSAQNFISSQTKLHNIRKNKIFYEQASTQRFYYHQACFTRASERSITHRNNQY